MSKLILNSTAQMKNNNFYDDGSIIIDSTKYTVSGTTYHINNITSVHIVEMNYNDKKKGCWITVILSSSFALFMFYTMTNIGLFLGLIAFIFAFFNQPAIQIFESEYHVEILTSLGLQTIFSTSDEDKVLSIVEAMNRAISAKEAKDSRKTSLL